MILVIISDQKLQCAHFTVYQIVQFQRVIFLSVMHTSYCLATHSPWSSRSQSTVSGFIWLRRSSMVLPASEKTRSDEVLVAGTERIHFAQWLSLGQISSLFCQYVSMLPALTVLLRHWSISSQNCSIKQVIKEVWLRFKRVRVTVVRLAFLIPATTVIPYRVYRNHGITSQLSPFPRLPQYYRCPHYRVTL